MRFVKCCAVVLAATTLYSDRVSGQGAAPQPVGVTRQLSTSSRRPASLDSSQTPLRVHVLRGGIIGGVVGLGLSGLVVVAVHSSHCQVFAPSAPGAGGGSCGNNLSLVKASGILLAGSAAGAAVGSMLGYTYHENENEQRAARCRANPTACP